MMDGIEQQIAGLSPAKRTILEGRLQDKTLATSGKLNIPRRTNQEESLLSFSQHRMWFLDRLEPGNPSYNRPSNIRFIGQLNVTTLEQSLNEIIRRHEVLRTNFPSVQGQPEIAIAPHLNLSLPIIDLCHVPTSEQQEKVEKLAAQEAQKSFDLAQDCLVRAILMRLREEEYILLLTFHQIIFDDCSREVLLKELAVLYDAFASGKPSPLTELAIQYADFAHWERQQFQKEEFSIKMAYWKQQLGGELPVLELPTNRQRSPVQTFRGARHNLNISSSLTTELKRLSQEEGATLFMTLLAAFKILLYRYTGQEDIIVGSPIAPRDRLEIENPRIGVFINTLALRVQLTGNLSFKNLLAQIRQVVLDAYKYQDIPFEKLVEELQSERNLRHSSIFQVLFKLRNLPQDKVQSKGIKFEEFKCENGIVAFDLILDICEKNAGLSCLFEYNTDLFEAATIERMAGHFETLLKGIIANPEQPICQLPLLTEAEQHQLLVEWNNTETEYPKDKCIHQLLEEQVEKTPDAIAVVFEEEQLTYGELNERANRLARYLQKLGVKPEVLVGICVERSLDMVVGLLGILKTGGAYLPLDPEYPQERLSFMLQDAQVSILLTQQQLLKRLPKHKAHVVYLDTDWPLISQSSQKNPITNVQATNLAYVIYTSGSTGQPKGVAMNHLALCNLLLWQLQNMTISSGAKTLQFAPVSFDVSFQEIFSTWCSGGILFLIGEELRRDALTLLDFLQQKAIERLFVPFVALQQLAEVAVGSELVNTHLREIITAGEQLQITPAISQWLSKLNDCTLQNHYGPSESHVVTTLTLTNPVETWPLLPPIGRPIANTQIYLLDSNLQPVPIGIPGELYIGGNQLARGYLNRLELTEEKFIPNPFSDKSNSRLYKTGDLTRYLPDGNIEFLGRIDHQVKIRGFRVELGEIEALLNQHPQVNAVVVLPREDQPGDKRLVAYLVPHQQQKPTTKELRKFLQQKLPDYMIPSAFVVLEAFPLTPNGKVDRRALPIPKRQLNRETEFIPPQTRIQEIVAAIWSQILRTPVSIHDNFFELGGNSLLATQVISRLREVLAQEISLNCLFEAPTVAKFEQNFPNNLSLSTLFQAPTVEELTEVLCHQRGTSPWYSLVPIQPGVDRPPLFGIHLNYFQYLVPHLGREQPVYALRYGMAEPTDRAVSLPKMEDLAAHYIQEMRSLQPEGPYFLMGLSIGGLIAYEMAQQLVAEGQQVGLLALFDSHIELCEPITELLPLRRRLSNLLHLGAAEFLRRAKEKVKWNFSRLRTVFTDQITSTTQYFPHIPTPEPSLQLLKAYTPKAYSGQVDFFKAIDEGTNEKKFSINYSYKTAPPEVGWKKFVNGKLEIHEVPGSHIGILEEPNVQVVANKLRLCINKVLENNQKDGHRVS